ncbi:thioredoxin family protein [Pseudomonas azotoformans]|uniref:thioredoxin family protein n=1 Tax=Pseudomonas sp. P7759 TaxID=2738831 RepID=UPI0015A47B1C|nr:thioredoxin family protein [Pseudomonas sp. P7759]NWC76611.1 thioredoxin family protein [Pseudomonas sp. P7759]
METATRKIADAKDFQRILNTPRPVFILFVSEHCPACGESTPLFELAAWKHPWIVSLVVDCAGTPRHPDVTGTPTLLIYWNGVLEEKLKGFGPRENQAQVVEATFKRYHRVHRPTLSALAHP